MVSTVVPLHFVLRSSSPSWCNGSTEDFDSSDLGSNPREGATKVKAQAMRTLNWPWIKSALAIRREQRKMEALGYKQVEVEWKLHRGDWTKKNLEDVKIASDGCHVWIKVEGISYKEERERKEQARLDELRKRQEFQAEYDRVVSLFWPRVSL